MEEGIHAHCGGNKRPLWRGGITLTVGGINAHWGGGGGGRGGYSSIIMTGKVMKALVKGKYRGRQADGEALPYDLDS